MAVFKGESATISLVKETVWGVINTLVGNVMQNAKFFQSNDGTFNAERSALESEARTPNAELSGQRLGNTNVSGSFPVEVDPVNYNEIFESVFYGAFTAAGVAVTAATSVLVGTLYRLTIPMDNINEGNLLPVTGNAYLLSGAGTEEIQALHGVHILESFNSAGDTMTFIVPEQTVASFTAGATDVITITPVESLRPGKTRTSFNAEETLNAEDGSTTARFMTVGVTATGAEIDLPADGTVKTTFSFLGSGKQANGSYTELDAGLIDDASGHDTPTTHTKHDPLVLQDGVIIAGDKDVRCAWLSGTVNIENGTETFFVGCSYDAAGANSGKFRVNVSYEALFESEAAYEDFRNEVTTSMVLRLNVRGTDNCILLYLPAFKATSYNVNVGTGLVTASISGSAEIDSAAINSVILAKYSV